MKRKRKSNGPFVAVPKAIMATPAWRAMSLGARLLWIELRGWLRNDGSNNGKAYLACRGAAKAIGTKSKGSIVRWYAENKHYGFVRKTAEGFLGLDGRGIAAHYRFTDLAHGTHPPTRDFEKWDGEPFAYTPRRDARKNRIPYPPWVHPVPTIGTYGSPGMGGPYVPTMGTYATPRGVPTRGTDLDFHTPLQKKSSYRVAQQLERRCKPEEPVRARPLFPA